MRYYKYYALSLWLFVIAFAQVDRIPEGTKEVGAYVGGKEDADFAALLAYLDRPPMDRPSGLKAGSPEYAANVYARRKRYRESAEAALAFHENHSQGRRKWDAVALAYENVKSYKEHYREKREDGRHGVDREESLRRLEALPTDDFVASAGHRRLMELVRQALVADDIDPLTRAVIAGLRIYEIKKNDQPSFDYLFAKNGDKKLLADKFAEAQRLFRSIEAAFPDGDPWKDSKRFGRWSVATAYRFSEYYLEMLGAIRPGSDEYMSELEWVAESAFEFSAQKAKKELARIATKGRPVYLSFQAIDGRRVESAELRGKVVLVDFWATWCAPCIAEMPNLRRVYEEYRSQGFEVIGVSLDREQDRAKVAAQCQSLGLGWPQRFSGQGLEDELATKYGISGLPAMLLLNKEGILVSTAARGERLEPEVRKHLGLLKRYGSNAQELVAYGSEWSYLDQGIVPPSGWTINPESVVGWKRGPAPLGYGGAAKRTIVEFGQDASRKHPATYFSRTFEVPAHQAGWPFEVTMSVDDGAVVYLNGREVGRVQVSETPVENDTLADQTMDPSKTEWEIVGPPHLLRAGTNIISVSVHQAKPDSSDIAFDLRVVAFPPQL